MSKTSQLNAAITIAGLTLLSTCPTLLAQDTGSSITQQELTDKNYSYPTDLVANANQTQLANYAWRLFIASMQQTAATTKSGTGRTTSSGQYSFIDTGSSSQRTNPLVFEGLYHRTEAYPYYTSTRPPSPINQPPVYYTYYENSSETKVAETVSGQNYVYLDETNQISQNFLYYQHSNDPNFPVLFMAKVNDLETEYASKQTSSPSSSTSWDFPDTTLEVKTAWRRVQDIKNSDPAQYHQATGNYWVAGSDGVPQLQTDTFALIAIHVIQKTANYQEFIFTTFEHVDAVTRDGNTITDPAYKTEYDKLSYQTPSSNPHTATALGAYDINEAGQPTKDNVLTTYTLPDAGPISTDYTTVVQPTTIIKQVNDVNNQVNALVESLDKGNIWANYRLKGVQATPTSDSDSANYYLANIVVESSQPGIQLFNGILLNGGVEKDGYLVNCRDVKGDTNCIYPGSSPSSSDPTTYMNVSLNVTQGKPVPAPQYTMGGCQGCHGAAQQLGRDFSFLANGALGNGKELDSVPASDLSAAERDAHNERMAQSSNAF